MEQAAGGTQTQLCQPRLTFPETQRRWQPVSLGMEVGTSVQTPTRVPPSPAPSFTDFLFSSLSPGSELQTTSEAAAVTS